MDWIGKIFKDDGEMINVKEHLGLVCNIAAEVHRKYASFEDYDDIFQNGCLGLLNAAEKFDESKGYKFSTYAYIHIAGYITNTIRKQRMGPRHGSYKSKYKPLSLNWNVDEDEKLEFIDILRYDENWNDIDLKIAIEKLPPIYEKLIKMKYFGGYKIRELMKIFGVSHTTINNYHRKALELLRKELAEER